ncbi:MAG: DoxX family protein [Acidobacteriota bacterium]
MENFYLVWSPRILSVLRMILGFMFAAHGTQKLLNTPATEKGAVELMSFMGLAGTLEMVGGALIVMGLFTRVTAFILCGMMAFAYFTAHAPGGFLPIVNKGELAVIYCFVFLYLSVAGGGPWSADAFIDSFRRPAGQRIAA